MAISQSDTYRVIRLRWESPICSMVLEDTAGLPISIFCGEVEKSPEIIALRVNVLFSSRTKQPLAYVIRTVLRGPMEWRKAFVIPDLDIRSMSYE